MGGIDAEFNVTEEMLEFQAIIDTVTGENTFQETERVMSKHHLRFDELRGVFTD
jgi:hypothetical protein